MARQLYHIWCDGSYRPRHRTGGIGIVFRDPNDPEEQEISKRLPDLKKDFNHGSDYAELKAAAHALSQVPNDSNVDIRIDCRNVIAWLQARELPKKKAKLPAIKRAFNEAVREVKRLGDVNFIWTSDTTNTNMGRAHILAKVGSSINPDEARRYYPDGKPKGSKRGGVNKKRAQKSGFSKKRKPKHRKRHFGA